MLLTRSNRVFPIFIKLNDGDTEKYCQAILYNKSGVPLDTVDLPHVVGGLYLEEYTYDGTEHLLIADYTVFTDDEYTLEDTSHNFPASVIIFDDSAPAVPYDIKLDDAENTLTVYNEDGETPIAVFDCENGSGDPAHRNIRRFRRRLS